MDLHSVEAKLTLDMAIWLCPDGISLCELERLLRKEVDTSITIPEFYRSKVNE